MDFVLWVSRVMHLISAVVWLGGLIFMNAVLHPVLAHRREVPSPATVSLSQRFLSFLWSSLWTLLATGLFLMLLSPRFRWFDVSTLWSQLLTAKIVLLGVVLFLSWQAGTVVKRIDHALKEAVEEAEGWHRTLEVLIRRSIVIGILSLLCAAGMVLI